MVLAMSKKEAPLPKRPQPPTVQNIIEDIDKSENDDIVFQKENDAIAGGDSTPRLMFESFSYEDSSPGSEKDEKHSPGDLFGYGVHAGSSEVESMYRQAVQFIDVSDTLRCAPDKLQSQCDHLRTASQELKETIKRLKDQSDAFDKKQS